MALTNIDKRVRKFAEPCILRQDVVTLDVSDDDQNIDGAAFELNATITHVILTLPNSTSTTVELKLRNADDQDIYASGEQDENGDRNLHMSRDVAGWLHWRLEFASAESADMEVTITAYGH